MSRSERLRAGRCAPAEPEFVRQWAGLAEARGAALLAGPLFQGALRQAFAPGIPARALAVWRGEALAGVLPLADLPLRRGPVTLRETGFARNAHTLRNDLLTGADAEALAALFAAWARKSGAETLLLENLAAEVGLARAIGEAAEAPGLAADPPTAGRRLDFAEIAAGHAAWLASRSGQFRRQNRKHLRPLEEAGALAIERLTGAELHAALPEWRAVVASSWQGEAAEADTPADWHLHALLAGNGALWLARLDGRPVAALRMLEDARVAYVHTMHYDQALRDLAPGVVLFDAMMEDACARGLARVDFNGHSEFFARWATGQAARMSIRLYRPSLRGRAARALRGLGRRPAAELEPAS